MKGRSALIFSIKSSGIASQLAVISAEGTSFSKPKLAEHQAVQFDVGRTVT